MWGTSIQKLTIFSLATTTAIAGKIEAGESRSALESVASFLTSVGFSPTQFRAFSSSQFTIRGYDKTVPYDSHQCKAAIEHFLEKLEYPCRNGLRVRGQDLLFELTKPIILKYDELGFCYKFDKCYKKKKLDHYARNVYSKCMGNLDFGDSVLANAWAVVNVKDLVDRVYCAKDDENKFCYPFMVKQYSIIQNELETMTSLPPNVNVNELCGNCVQGIFDIWRQLPYSPIPASDSYRKFCPKQDIAKFSCHKAMTALSRSPCIYDASRLRARIVNVTITVDQLDFSIPEQCGKLADCYQKENLGAHIDKAKYNCIKDGVTPTDKKVFMQLERSLKILHNVACYQLNDEFCYPKFQQEMENIKQTQSESLKQDWCTSECSQNIVANLYEVAGKSKTLKNSIDQVLQPFQSNCNDP